MYIINIEFCHPTGFPLSSRLDWNFLYPSRVHRGGRVFKAVKKITMILSVLSKKLILSLLFQITNERVIPYTCSQKRVPIA